MEPLEEIGHSRVVAMSPARVSELSRVLRRRSRVGDDVVQVPRSDGADTDTRTMSGSTPFIIASADGRMEMSRCSSRRPVRRRGRRHSWNTAVTLAPEQSPADPQLAEPRRAEIVKKANRTSETPMHITCLRVFQQAVGNCRRTD